MNGHEVCRIIKKNKKLGDFVPVILMTAGDDVKTRVECLEIGADDYLTKPLNPLELEARVKSMLRLKNLQDEIQHSNDRLKSMNEYLQQLSTTDALMNISNRLFFNKRIQYEFQRAGRYDKPLALLILDIDHFKNINDTFGHPFGDEVLREIAKLLLDSVREVDIVARYGGEEIVVAMPETDQENALVVAERIRSVIESHTISKGQQKASVTVSLGLAVCPADCISSVDDLLKAADDALYLAKKDGRNCIKTSHDKA
jgi:diguanylate cyclase (GGDEF)-like protein